jgi:glycosyltransferase involved in cell wall biosynthesis
MKNRISVVAIVANVKKFRKPFYIHLWEKLNSAGIDLHVIYSSPSNAESTKHDSVDLPAHIGKKVPRIYFRNKILLQMPPIKIIVDANLVIVVQSNSYIISLVMVIIGYFRFKKVAYWGHGFNRQGNPNSFSEKVKRKFATLAYWWFAYTSSAQQHLIGLGFPRSRLTVIQNAIDTSGFRRELAEISSQEVDDFLKRTQLTSDDKIGLYCGSLYAEKKIDYLLEAASKLAKEDPNFRLIIVGSGPLQSMVTEAASEKSFIRYLGPLFGRDKAICFKIADVVLNPGLVGLGILDAFAAGLPFLTTTNALHSPEIDYLDDGANGILVNGDPEMFASVARDILNDNARSELIKKGANESGLNYTLENMVDNVFTGVLNCLEGSQRNMIND